MIESAYIIRPLIGAVIGYITNDIAIRMQFRPRKAKYCFGFRMPFTPGLIPKEKQRIAASIGDAVSKNLLNREVLETTLLSDNVVQRIRDGFDSFVASQLSNGESLRQFLSRYVPAEDVERIGTSVSQELSANIYQAMAGAEIGAQIASMATEHVLQKVGDGLLGKLGAERMLGLVASPLEKLLARHIDEMVKEDSAEVVDSLVSGHITTLLDTPVCRLLEGREEQLHRLRESLLSIYRRVVAERLPSALTAVDISRMIEERINAMDVRETERLILDVMRRELKAIVWLGALLGFMMGCINLLF
nr:DUF445 family protein [Muribaculaceae bacterium]